MAYCVRYFSVNDSRIVTNFLGFSEVTDTTANTLYTVFKGFLANTGLKLEKLIGIGTDGASVLCGCNHSLYTLLKEDLPDLQLIKCTCHSIDKCASKAADELPSNIQFLMRETNNWFAHSALRLSRYRDFFAEHRNGSKPRKFISLSATRWLVVYLAVTVIIEQWDVLKSFFTQAAQTTERKCYTTRQLALMYNDNSNILYLTLLEGILRDVYDVNQAFQGRDADITRLYGDLRVLIVSLARRIFKPAFLRSLEPLNASSSMLSQSDLDTLQQAVNKASAEFGNSLLPHDSMDLGSKFENLVAELRIQSTVLVEIKERAVQVILRLCEELMRRLPPNLTVFNKMRYLLPSVCLKTNPQNVGLKIKASNLPWDLASNGVDKDAIEAQYRQLQDHTLFDISPNLASQSEPVDVVHFWIAVWGVKKVNGERQFGDLAALALRALSLPVSNAEVERVFSFMTTIKTKLRNRMLIPMLVALIRVRIHMSVQGVCCKTYEPTQRMLSRFNKSMYESDPTDQINPDDRLLLEAFELFESTMTPDDNHNFE